MNPQILKSIFLLALCFVISHGCQNTNVVTTRNGAIGIPVASDVACEQICPKTGPFAPMCIPACNKRLDELGINTITTTQLKEALECQKGCTTQEVFDLIFDCIMKCVQGALL